MEILGIGAPELVFVIVIALIVLGPKDMQKTGRTIGRWLNQLVNSDGWKAFQQTSREIRNLPTNLMREANQELAETERELRKATDFRPTPPASSRSRSLNQSQEAENSIQPPPANLPKTQAIIEPVAEDNAGANGIASSTQSESSSADSDHALDISHRPANDSVERKPDVNTTDQNA
jgi:sec-independent protein translocase protein TatB